MNYLLNSPMLTQYGTYRLLPCDEQQLCAFAQAPFESAIGHEGAARWLTGRLGVVVPCRRREIHMRPGDCALVLRLLKRLPEGQLLDAMALGRWPHEFAWLECLADTAAAPHTTQEQDHD